MPGRRPPTRIDPDPPRISLKNLPPWCAIINPLDGGFWLVDKRTNLRIRRITTDDLHKDEMKNQWNRGRRAPGADETD